MDKYINCRKELIMRKVIIAEKPSLARNIVMAIDKNMKKRDGYFENDQYIVTYAFGHLFTLYDIEKYFPNYNPNEKYLWKEDILPFFPEEFKFGLTNDEGVIKQFKIIRTLINQDDVDGVVNAGDSDREGEIIIRIILKYALKKDVKIYRLWMPDQTPKTILNELNNMKYDSFYDSLANEGLARTYVDWCYGINLTRFATIKSHTLLRVGRVISPIVQAIYNREMAIINFVPRKYYVLSSKEKTNGEEIELTSKLEFEINELDKIKEKQEEYNHELAYVKEIVSEDKIIPPGKLFSLSKLQGEMGKKYKFSLDQTLQIAQSLYEKGYISYPRTPSQYLAENEKDKFKEIISCFQKLNVDIVFKDGKSIFDDSKIESHSALTPTYKIPKKSELSEDEYKVYKSICNRFFSVFSKEACKISRTNLIINLGDKEEFKLTGDIVLSKGWTKFEEREKKDRLLPNLKVNDQVAINFQPLEKESKPPKRYSVESLNNFLKNPFKENKDNLKNNEDENEKEELLAMFEGIELGTEATRSGIIKNAINSNYISLKDNVYKLEPNGKYYVETLDALHMILSKEKTAELGKSLKKVYRNEITIDDSVDIAKKEITNLISLAKPYKFQMAPRIFEVDKKSILCKCPKCGNSIVSGEKGFRCNNSVCKMGLYFDNKLFAHLNKKVTKSLAKEIFTKGQVEYNDLISKNGNKYSSIIKADFSGEYLQFKFEFPKKDNNKKENDKNG